MSKLHQIDSLLFMSNFNGPAYFFSHDNKQYKQLFIRSHKKNPGRTQPYYVLINLSSYPWRHIYHGMPLYGRAHDENFVFVEFWSSSRSFFAGN